MALSPTRYEFSANAGDTISGTVEFWNGTDSFLPVQVEASDFDPQGEEGHVVVIDDGAGKHSIKDWISFSYPAVSVAPKQKFRFDFTLKIPEYASAGSHWGAAVVKTVPGAGEGTSLEVKLASIVLLNVYGEVEENMILEGISTSRIWNATPVVLTSSFRNNGTVYLAPRGIYEIKNVFGVVADTIELPQRNVLPGYTRKIDATGGDDLRFGRYTAVLRAEFGKGVTEVTAKIVFWVIPWKKYGIPFLLCMGFIVFVIVKRKNFKAAFQALRTGEDN